MMIINHDDNTAINYTEVEFNMYNLQCIAKENVLTTEQQNAIDYGISAIKTLKDMGILEWKYLFTRNLTLRKLELSKM